VQVVDIGAGQQFAPNFVRISPNNKIPAIVDPDGPDGQPISVFESGAILLYLAEKTGLFLPREGRARVEVLEWLMFQMGGFGPVPGQVHHFIALDAESDRRYGLERYMAETRRLYGVDEPTTEDFGRRCLTARRLAERGVRFVQVWSGAGGPTNNWDNHSNISKELPPMCASMDRPVSALLTDLNARGLLEDTLVLWNTEFGRMPFSQSSDGRDHNGGTFVGWMAGGGVKAGASWGESDEWGWKAAVNPTTTYDFHATVLHLLGIDHERLAVRHNGANRRLTDVHGHVIQELLA
jgi:hypothetical protein